MTGAYRVASLLPEHARRAAVEADYGYKPATFFPKLTTRPANPDETVNRCTADGCCPLSMALRALGAQISESPDEDEFGATAVELALCDPEERRYAEQAAATFFEDWDGGKITDLAAALDVEPSSTLPSPTRAPEHAHAPESSRANEKEPE